MQGVFLGYHVQPGHNWRGEYLVAKLEALDYHAENNSISIQRTKKVELLPGGFSFPLRAKRDRMEAIPDDHLFGVYGGVILKPGNCTRAT